MSKISVIQKDDTSIAVVPTTSEVIPAVLQHDAFPQPHAFLIPEILGNVFEYLSKHDLASSMRVCRSWPDIVAIALWKNLDSLLPLMKVLAPMTQEGDFWRFVAIGDLNLQEANWERLEYHASYVRSLDNTGIRITDNACWTVYFALQNRSQRLLPNLHDVKLDVGCNVSPSARKLSTAFISSTVDRLRFASNTDGPSGFSLQRILQDLGVHNISLTEFELSTNWHAVFDQKFFNGYETLRLPGLQELSFHTKASSPNPNPKHFFGEQHNLRRFSFSFKFFSYNFPPFFESLVDMAPHLQILECQFFYHGVPQLSFGLLRPLLQLSRLSTLKINHAIDLTIEDIRAMGSSWRTLTSLCFRPDLQQQSNLSGPPVSVLLVMAECFPKTFRSLEIAVRCDDNLPQIRDGEHELSSKMDMLAIDIERPIMEEEFSTLANLLAHLTTPNAKIQTGRPKALSSFFDAPQWDQAATMELELAVRRARRLSEK